MKSITNAIVVCTLILTFVLAAGATAPEANANDGISTYSNLWFEEDIED